MEKVPGHLRLGEAFTAADGTEVAIGHGVGGQYLVLSMSGQDGACWVCAPASDVAVDCVRTGRTSPWAVVDHSATGTVDIYRSGLDGSVADSVVLCSQLPLGRKVLVAA